MKRILKPVVLFCVGGGTYILIEIIYRYLMGKPHTHWSMFILGGLAFLIIGRINEHVSWEVPFWLQVIIGTCAVLILEFLFGCVLNLWLGLAIWDYSNLPFNILGQVCLPFALIWSMLVSIAIVLDDYLRYWLFGEEKPVYHWRFNSNNK